MKAKTKYYLAQFVIERFPTQIIHSFIQTTFVLFIPLNLK